MDSNIISIGILAYNEAKLIGKTIDSLLTQNIFHQYNSSTEIEIIIVPNGCTDDTAKIAQDTLAQRINQNSITTKITWQVYEVQQPGKSNAWNVFVHQLSNAEADYLLLMDSDIQLLESTTITSMIEVLKTMPQAWVAVDKPIKDIYFKDNKNIIEQLSIQISKLSGKTKIPGQPAWICGQLYCAKAKILRKLWLPNNLPTQDAFLYTMIVTDNLKTSEVPERVILAPSASHLFEAYINPRRLLRHEKWLILGSAINQLIYQELLANRAKEAGLFIKEKNQQEPLWVQGLIKKSLLQNQWWLIPNYIIIRRIKSLLDKSVFQALLFLPISLLSFMLDLVLSLQANCELKQRGKIGYWNK
ncbi:hypothetical protein STA3757_01610 [Stanieria sp. NIES-3757]|nr:hypothetical protein STA3757_01610 [Stanieria sp. NIES-3757]